MDGGDLPVTAKVIGIERQNVRGPVHQHKRHEASIMNLYTHDTMVLNEPSPLRVGSR